MSIIARVQNIPTYVQEVRAKTGYYIGWIPNEYADAPTADNFYTILENDSAVAHGMNLLSYMAAGEGWSIYCQDERLKTLLEYVFNNIEDFIHVRQSLIYSSVLFGLGVQRKYYDEVYLPAFSGMWTVPKRIREVDRRRLRIERDVDDKNRLYWTIWCPRVDQYIVIEDRSRESKASLAVQDFVWAIHQWEELAPYFRGLGNVLYTLAYVKSKVFQYWADLCESWAKPFLVALIDSTKAAVTAALGSGFATTTERVKQLLDTFEQARARHSVVLDKNDEVTFHEAGTSGNNIISELLSYCDRRIQQLMLGAELTTEAPSVGSYALGEIHRDATNSIIQYNRLRLQEVIERDILFDFLYRNRYNLLENDIRYPSIGEVKFLIKLSDQKEQDHGQQQQR